MLTIPSTKDKDKITKLTEAEQQIYEMFEKDSKRTSLHDSDHTIVNLSKSLCSDSYSLFCKFDEPFFETVAKMLNLTEKDERERYSISLGFLFARNIRVQEEVYATIVEAACIESEPNHTLSFLFKKKGDTYGNYGNC